MFWMINCATSVTESSVVENMLPSSAATSTVYNIIVSTAGPPFIPCRPSSVIDP